MLGASMVVLDEKDNGQKMQGYPLMSIPSDGGSICKLWKYVGTLSPSPSRRLHQDVEAHQMCFLHLGQRSGRDWPGSARFFKNLDRPHWKGNPFC